jgi:hypothetical protein
MRRASRGNFLFLVRDEMIKKLTLAVLATLSTAALADINVGVSVAATGPAASLGIPEKTPSRCCRPPSAARRSIHRAR